MDNTYKWQKSYRFTIILGLLRFSALLTFLIDDEFWRHHISSGLSRLPARAQAELFLLFRIEAVKLLLPLSAASSSHVIALWQRCICNITRCMINHLGIAKCFAYIGILRNIYYTNKFRKNILSQNFLGLSKIVVVVRRKSFKLRHHLVALFVISIKTRLMHLKVQKKH